MAREFVAQFRSAGAEKLQSDFSKIGKTTGTLDTNLKKVDQTSVRTQRRMSEVGATVGNLARGLAALGAARWLGDAAKDASQLEVNMRGLETVVGGVVASGFTEWAKENGDRLNLSASAAAQAANSLAVYAGQIQDAGGDATDFTTRLVEMASELAAFKGANPEEVIGAMGSALRGEMDPLEQFGIALKVSDVNARALADGLATTEAQITAADRAQASFNLIMDAGAFAMGSTERNADTLTGQMSDLRQKTDDLKVTIGQALIPVLSTLLGAVSDLADGFGKLPGPVKLFVGAFAGLVVLRKTIGPMFSGFTQSLANLRTDMGKTTGAAAKFKVGMGSIVSAFNPWTLALTAGIALVGLWIKKNQEAKQRTDEWTAGIEGATGALNEQGEAFLATQLKDFVDDAKAAKVPLEDIAAAMASADPSAYEALREQILATTSVAVGAEGQRARLHTDEAEAAFDLIDGLNGLRKERDDGAAAAAAAATATDAVTGATTAQSAATEDAAANMKALRGEVKDATDAYQKLLDNFTAVNDAMIDARSTVYDYQGAIDDLAKSLVEGKGNFSPDAEAGRENWDNLVSLAEAANGRITTTLKTKGTDAARTVYENARQTMFTMLTQAGVAGPRAWNLINDVLKKPHDIHISLNKVDVGKLENRLAKLRKRKAEIKAGLVLPPHGEAGSRDVVEQLRRQLKPINAKIHGVVGELKGPKDDLDDAANPDGKPRKAKINPKVDPAGLAATNTQLDYAARDRFSTIHVNTVTAPTVGPTPGGLSLVPQLFGAADQAGLRAAGRALTGPTMGATPYGYATPSAAPDTSHRVQLAPRQTPVAVYLDGVEIANRIEARRAMAAATSVRRSA